MESRLDQIEAKFNNAYEGLEEFNLLGKTAQELNAMRIRAERELNRLKV